MSALQLQHANTFKEKLCQFARAHLTCVVQFVSGLNTADRNQTALRQWKYRRVAHDVAVMS